MLTLISACRDWKVSTATIKSEFHWWTFSSYHRAESIIRWTMKACYRPDYDVKGVNWSIRSFVRHGSRVFQLSGRVCPSNMSSYVLEPDHWFQSKKLNQIWLGKDRYWITDLKWFEYCFRWKGGNHRLVRHNHVQIHPILSLPRQRRRWLRSRMQWMWSYWIRWSTMLPGLSVRKIAGIPSSVVDLWNVLDKEDCPEDWKVEEVPRMDQIQ